MLGTAFPALFGGRRAIAIAVAAVAVVAPLKASAQLGLAAPCSASGTAGGDWRSYGHDAANTRRQDAETTLTPARVSSLAPAWVFSTATVGDTAGGFNSTPIVADGCVFAGSAGGRVYALDAQTGVPQWQATLDAPSPGLGGALVGAPAVADGRVYVLVNQTGGPYAVALDEHTGATVWRSPAVTTYPGSYTNASSALFRGLLFMGFSAPEGDSHGQGGWGLIDTATGAIVKVTTTIPPADQAQGYAGGGIWSTPAFDVENAYAYVSAGNPFSKAIEHPYTNSILKIDLDRARSTFGEVVAHYKGNVDQYTETLQTISTTPVCVLSDQPGVPFPLDDPACAQLDLDFGASPNLFTDAQGRRLVGALQKAGVYHAARADTMAPAWATLVGAACAACNAASTAFDGTSIAGVATPGGLMVSLDATSGGGRWTAPIGDVVHYQSTSTAAGVVYTIDGNGFLDAFDATTGASLLRRQTALDTGNVMSGSTSSAGVAVAGHTVFVAAPGGAGPLAAGYVIAYR